jgi:hypothetical protein
VLVFLLELAYFQKILGLPSKGITLIWIPFFGVTGMIY